MLAEGELLPGLKITVDASEVAVGQKTTSNDSTNQVYCACQTEYCTCASPLGVTEFAAKKIYLHQGYTGGREAMAAEAYRLNTLHVWGTQQLSTNELLVWTGDYSPSNVEWIDDASCNIVFPDENASLRALISIAEPFDRRVALKAATALASAMLGVAPARTPQSTLAGTIKSPSEAPGIDISMDSHSTISEDRDTISLQDVQSDGVLPVANDLTQYMPSSGRWFKSVASPKRTFSLFLRYAHISDMKLPGAERRSDYYRRFGNPNYGGMVGLLSRSYRRRVRDQRKADGAEDNGAGDLRRVLHVCHPHEEKQDFTDIDATELDEASPNKNFVRGLHVTYSRKHTEVTSEASTTEADRDLVVYDDLYDDDFLDDMTDLAGFDRDIDDGLIKVHAGVDARCKVSSMRVRSSKPFPPTGSRREAIDVGGMSPFLPQHPRKWPRSDHWPKTGNWRRGTNTPTFFPPADALREPWSGEVSRSGDFSGFRGSDRFTPKSYKNPFSGSATRPLATVTLMPDDSPTREPQVHVPMDDEDEDENLYRSRRLLASLRMVADMEEEKVFNRLTAAAREPGVRTHRRNAKSRLGRGVWGRLG